jgi:arylsulfatase B/arylsulfatase I/J
MPQVEEFPLLLPLSSGGNDEEIELPPSNDARASYLSTVGRRIGSVLAVAFLITGTLEAIAMGRTSTTESEVAETNFQTESLSLMASSTSGKTSSNPLPHLVFVLLDDAGWNDFGYQSVDLSLASPNMNILSANGVRLHNYYTQPSCTPARASLMTGRNPISLGMQHECIQPGSAWGLPLQFKTLADELKESGYYTAMVGKWDLGHYAKQMWPTERGFDSWLGLTCRGISNYFTYDNGGYNDIHRDLAPAPEMMDVYSTEAFRTEALRVIDEHATDRDGQPLFLYVAFNAIHDLLMVPTSFEETEIYTRVTTNITFDNRQLAGGAMYIADSAIGDLVESLKTNNMYDNSVLVVVSDNGGSPADGGNNWPLRGAKKDYYQGGVRVPGFVHSPLIEASGGKVGRYFHSPVHVSDWFPTFVKGIIGREVSSDLDGVDQWAAIVSGALDNDLSNAPRQEVLHNIDYLSTDDTFLAPSKVIGAMTATEAGTLYKIILNDRGDSDGTWYLPYSSGQIQLEGGLTDSAPVEGMGSASYENETKFLFDLQSDPYELKNLWDHKPFQALKNRLITRLCSYYPKMVDTVYVERVSGTDKKDMVASFSANGDYITWWNTSSDSEVSQFPIPEYSSSEGDYDVSSCPFSTLLADLSIADIANTPQVGGFPQKSS